MELHNLKPAKGSVRKSKRIARGEGSGSGDTATRGHKGAKSRSGYSRKLGFEGGQMPLQRRLPKFGFHNINRVAYKPINLDSISQLAEAKKLDEIKVEDFIANGMADRHDKIKVLGRGELKSKVSVQAHKFSNTARKAIEDKGGEAKNV